MNVAYRRGYLNMLVKCAQFTRPSEDRGREFIEMDPGDLKRLHNAQKAIHQNDVAKDMLYDDWYDWVNPWRWIQSGYFGARGWHRNNNLKRSKRMLATNTAANAKPLDYWGMLTAKRLNPNAKFVALNPGSAAEGYSSMREGILSGLQDPYTLYNMTRNV